VLAAKTAAATHPLKKDRASANRSNLLIILKVSFLFEPMYPWRQITQHATKPDQA
jgi:hypothetical protein